MTSNLYRQTGCLGDECISTSFPKTGLAIQIFSFFYEFKVSKKPKAEQNTKQKWQNASIMKTSRKNKKVNNEE